MQWCLKNAVNIKNIQSLERDQSVHRRHFNSTASDESSSGCREDPGTKHGPDQGCSRGMSATAHRRTNCGCHRAAQDYAKNTHA